MKIVTATKTGQGIRANDYSYTTEGELVRIDVPCATDGTDPDGRCGCARGFAGLSSHTATTTAKVRDLPMSREAVVRAFPRYYPSAGYGVVPRDEVEREVNDLLGLATQYAAGTILERGVDIIRPRR